MDEQERKRVLEVMRQALKQGRAQRREDMADERENLSEAIRDAKAWAHPVDEQHLNRTLQRQKSRDMLAPAKLPGRKKPVKLAAIKTKEKYRKRPSVRALKRSRANQGPSM